MLHGSTRIITDVDLLVSLDSLDKFVTAREAVLGWSWEGLQIKTAST